MSHPNMWGLKHAESSSGEPASSDWQLVQFEPSFTPSGVMVVEKGDEGVTMPGLEEVHHLVDDDILEEVLGLLHQFGVQTDVAGA